MRLSSCEPRSSGRRSASCGPPTRRRRRGRPPSSPPRPGRRSRPAGIGGDRGAARLQRRARAGDALAGRSDEPRVHPVGADARRRRLRPGDERGERVRRRVGGGRRSDLRRERGARVDHRAARLAGERRGLLRRRRHRREPLGARGRAARGARRVAASARRAAGGWPAPPTRTPRSGSPRACSTSGSSRCPATRDGRLTGRGAARRAGGRTPTTSSPSSPPPARRTPASSTTSRAWPTPAREHGLWLHVDGAYGGAALAAPSVRERFAGIERADSFIVDPHKWLFAPYDCCALSTATRSVARAAHAQTASYLDQIDREASNPADLAIHLSRRARGLPFWFSLATHGTDRYVAAVERTLATARTVAAAIRASSHLDLVCEPDLSVLLFERPGWDDDAYASWSKRLASDGVILSCRPAGTGAPSCGWPSSTRRRTGPRDRGPGDAAVNADLDRHDIEDRAERRAARPRVLRARARPTRSSASSSSTSPSSTSRITSR